MPTPEHLGYNLFLNGVRIHQGKSFCCRGSQQHFYKYLLRSCWQVNSMTASSQDFFCLNPFCEQITKFFLFLELLAFLFRYYHPGVSFVFSSANCMCFCIWQFLGTLHFLQFQALPLLTLESLIFLK